MPKQVFETPDAVDWIRLVAQFQLGIIRPDVLGKRVVMVQVDGQKVGVAVDHVHVEVRAAYGDPLRVVGKFDALPKNRFELVS